MHAITTKLVNSQRPAYHVDWKYQFGSKRGPTTRNGSPSASDPVWKILWKLYIPSKFKIFCWNALHVLSPVFGRYRIRLIQRQWRLGTESGSLEGNGDSVDPAGVPAQKPGHRSKLTRKWTTRKTRVATRQENPGSARTG